MYGSVTEQMKHNLAESRPGRLTILEVQLRSQSVPGLIRAADFEMDMSWAIAAALRISAGDHGKESVIATSVGDELTAAGLRRDMIMQRLQVRQVGIRT